MGARRRFLAAALIPRSEFSFILPRMAAVKADAPSPEAPSLDAIAKLYKRGVVTCSVPCILLYLVATTLGLHL